MRDYPFDNIHCNGRLVSIDTIVRDQASSQNAFESSLFSFIRLWLTNTALFSLTTSGSTGTPKQIVLSREQMVASARLTCDALQLRRGDRALLCLNPDYIAGKMMIVRSLEAGMEIIAVTPSSNPAGQFPPVDFAAMVPLQIHDALHRGHAEIFNHISKVIIGGGNVDADDVRLLQPLPCRFFATYGMTETISHVALRPLNGEDASPFFKALPGIRFSVDSRGCLVVHWSILGNDMVTNDLVDLLDNERFVWLGRFDNIINSGGKKVIPEKLEESISNVLRSAGLHHRFFVSSVPDARLGNKIVMVLEDPYMLVDREMIRSKLRSILSHHEVPKEFFLCEAFQMTETGKINRNTTLGLAILRNSSTE